MNTPFPIPMRPVSIQEAVAVVKKHAITVPEAQEIEGKIVEEVAGKKVEVALGRMVKVAGRIVKITETGPLGHTLTPCQSPTKIGQGEPFDRLFKKLSTAPPKTIPEESILAPESDEEAELYTNIGGKRWRVIRREPAITLCIGCNEERLAYKSACHNIEHAVCIACAKYITNNTLSGEGCFNRCPICREDVPDIEQRKKLNATLLQWMNLTELQCVECSWRGVYENIDTHVECPTSPESPAEATPEVNR